MALIDYKRIERVIKLDKTVFKEIRDDKNALWQCVATLIMIGIIQQISNLFVMMVTKPQQANFIIFSTAIILLAMLTLGWIVVPIALGLGALIPHLTAKYVFKGKAEFVGYAKVLGYVSVLGVFSAAIGLFNMLPIYGGLIAIGLSLALWTLSIYYEIVATSEAHEITKGQAAIAVLMPLAILLAILVGIIALLFGLRLFVSSLSHGY